MKPPEGPIWLDWAREIQAIGQTGLHFSTNEFDRIRYERLVNISCEIFSKSTGMPADFFGRIYITEQGYACPKIDVRAVVFKGEEILLVQERSDLGWSLPGGWADVNEPPSSMVEREVREESGFEVKARKVIGVYEANHDRDPIAVYHAYKVIFLCDLESGAATPSVETADVNFFAINALPPLSPFRTKLEYIQEAFAHLRDPNREAYFD